MSRERDLCLLVGILRQLLDDDNERVRAANRRHLAHARSHLDRDPRTGRVSRSTHAREDERPGAVSAARGMTSAYQGGN